MTIETKAAGPPWPGAGTAYWTVFLLILSLTSLQLDTNIVPYVAGSIKADLQLSDTELGLLLGVAFALFYTLVGIPIAWLVDRFSRKWIIAIGIFTWSLGTALCGAAQSYWQLFFARFVVGAGEAGNGPASYSVLADLFPREKMPRAIAIMQLGSVIGPALALGIGAYLLHVFLDMPAMQAPWGPVRGWQLVLILVGLPGIAISLLMLATMKEPPRRAIAGQAGGEALTATGPFALVLDYGIALKYMARHWTVFAPMFGGLFFAALGQGAQQWLPIFYERQFGWHPGRLAGWQSFFQLVLMPLGMAFGVLLAERYGRQMRDDAAMRVQIIGRLIGLPGLFAVLAPTPELALAGSALTLFSIGFFAPSMNAALQIVCPAEMRGKVTSLYLFFYSVVGIGLSPIITGVITDYVFRDESMIRWSIFVPGVILGPLSLIVTWLGLRPYAREIARLRALEG